MKFDFRSFVVGSILGLVGALVIGWLVDLRFIVDAFVVVGLLVLLFAVIDRRVRRIFNV